MLKLRDCVNCQNKTNNKKYCSRNCAATYSNKIIKRRKRSNKCKTCSTLILSSRTYCSPCFSEYFNKQVKTDINVVTIQDCFGLRKFQKSSKIRSLARAYVKKVFKENNKLMACAVCGYSNHVEVCHIKPIYSFDTSAYLSEVNSLSNLTILCPNHHWELDNGVLKEPVGGIEPLD